MFTLYGIPLLQFFPSRAETLDTERKIAALRLKQKIIYYSISIPIVIPFVLIVLAVCVFVIAIAGSIILEIASPFVIKYKASGILSSSVQAPNKIYVDRLVSIDRNNDIVCLVADYENGLTGRKERGTYAVFAKKGQSVKVDELSYPALCRDAK